METIVSNCHISFQGANASQLEKEIGADQFPPNEHYIGLVNVSASILHAWISFWLCVKPIVSDDLVRWYIFSVLRFMKYSFISWWLMK